MKIDTGNGTPIYVARRRHASGVELIQGRSRVRISAAELPEFLRVLREMTNDAQGQEKVHTSGYPAVRA
jgi:hypothetical protein